MLDKSTWFGVGCLYFLFLIELTPPMQVPSKDNFDTLSALDIAEQLTYLDHQIFIAIRSE